MSTPVIAAATRQFYISGLKVHVSQSDTPPDLALREINTNISDINSGLGRQCVYLVPQYTEDPTQACTSFSVDIRDSPREGFTDLTAGLGFDYRYLIPTKDPHLSSKISEVALYRRANKNGPIDGDAVYSIQSRGFAEWTGDINRDCGGDYLYLVWKNLTMPDMTRETITAMIKSLIKDESLGR
ncbi:hypothetical protein M426DRAFT_21962 [Hypoxylon sp. CI-4A]|nr:hypothetical protein M426DRAFT_21962 [Hypoxylon sp. CI-4A]